MPTSQSQWNKKKDAGKKDVQVVLDPIDYPRQQVSSEERYRYHYSMWQIWNREIEQNLESPGTGKKQKYVVEQLQAQIFEMKKYLIQNQLDGLDGYLKFLEDLNKEFQKPEMMRSYKTMLREIKREARMMREQYSPNNETLHYISADME